MFCEGCSERMTRETVVFVTRGLRRGRSIAQPGWYCWTCKASRCEADAAGDARRDSGRDSGRDCGRGSGRDLARMPLLRRFAEAVARGADRHA